MYGVAGMLRADSHALNTVLELRARSSGIDSNASSNMTRVETARAIRAILFDKDGTLVDFQQTWGPAVHDVMQTLAAGHHAIYERLAAAIGFVESEQSFLPDSDFHCGTYRCLGSAVGSSTGMRGRPPFSHRG